MPDTGTKLVASNRKARRDFTILETFEAGLVLRGAEVKSLRTDQVQMADAYARFGRRRRVAGGRPHRALLLRHGHRPARP